MVGHCIRQARLTLWLGACLLALAVLDPRLPGAEAGDGGGASESRVLASSSRTLSMPPSALLPRATAGASGRLVRADQHVLATSLATLPSASRAALGFSNEAGAGLPCQPECPATTCCEDRFHFTTVRLWLYRNFVPDLSDPDVLGFEVNSAWGWGSVDVTNISYFELADYPQAVPGRPAGNPVPGVGAATGMSDFMSAFLFSKKRAHHGPHHFSAGFAVQLPTAPDSTLGSGKWSVGPAIEYEYERGKFFAAFVAINFWSVAGDSNRADVNMLMIKPMITYEFSPCWKAVYMPYGITVYWTKPIDEAIYLPLGGGVQRDFRLGSLDMAASLQLFKYVLRSTKGPEHELRFMLEFNF